jgi:hypothetical protein
MNHLKKISLNQDKNAIFDLLGQVLRATIDRATLGRTVFQHGVKIGPQVMEPRNAVFADARKLHAVGGVSGSDWRPASGFPIGVGNDDKGTSGMTEEESRE